MTTFHASTDNFSKIALLLLMVNTFYFVEAGSTPFSFSGARGWSAMDCCVYWCSSLLDVCRCWRSGVINCIVNFQPKRKNSFLWVFGVLLPFNLDIVASFTQAMSSIRENAATVHLDDFGLTEYFPIFW